MLLAFDRDRHEVVQARGLDADARLERVAARDPGSPLRTRFPRVVRRLVAERDHDVAAVRLRPVAQVATEARDRVRVVAEDARGELFGLGLPGLERALVFFMKLWPWLVGRKPEDCSGPSN